MFAAIMAGIASIILAVIMLIIGAYLVKLWYMVPERKMTKFERMLNKFVEVLIVEDWYPED